MTRKEKEPPRVESGRLSVPLLVRAGTCSLTGKRMTVQLEEAPWKDEDEERRMLLALAASDQIASFMRDSLCPRCGEDTDGAGATCSRPSCYAWWMRLHPSLRLALVVEADQWRAEQPLVAPLREPRRVTVWEAVSALLAGAVVALAFLTGG